jgi:hypothetical protein
VATGAVLVGVLPSCGGNAPAAQTGPASRGRFPGAYGTPFERCDEAQRLKRGGSDLRVIGISCRRASELVRGYAVHPAERVESLATFGCYAYRPRTGLAAQRVVCVDSARAEAFRFDRS